MVVLLLTLFMQRDTTYNLGDFRIPEEGIMRLELKGGFTFGHREELLRYDTTEVEDKRYLQNTLLNNIGLCWDLNVNGEQRFIHLGLYPDFMLYYQDYLRQYAVDSVQSWASFDSRAGGSGTFYGGWYIGESHWFLGGSSYFSEHGIMRYNYLTEDFVFNWSDPRVEVLLGGGLGKVRNVGAAARAWLFLEENAVASYENIDVLGNILAKEWKYQLKYWRYHKYFYQDLENLLLEKSIVERLSPYQAMRLREILDNTNQFDRLSGTRISLLGGLGYNVYGRDNDDLEPQINLSILGGYPISRRWQVSYSSYNTLYLPLYHYIEGYRPDLRSSIELYISHYIGDSWMLSSGLSGNLDANNFLDYTYSAVLNLVPVQIIWYLDNNIDLQVKPSYTIEIMKVWDNVIRTNRQFGLHANLTWRLR